MISIAWNQNNEIIISSINADTVQNKLNYCMEEDYGLTESFVLRSFNIESNSSIYDVINTSKTIDTIFFSHNDKIKNKTLKQVFNLYKSTSVSENLKDIGTTLVSRYYFINEEPVYQLGRINDELGANISFNPNFESNFSGIIGMSNLENNWNVNGELNLQIENYFQNAER